MTQLTAAVSDTAMLWTVDVLPDAPYLQVEDELVAVEARFAGGIYAPTGATIPPKIRVDRAEAGTTAASHANGSTLTPVYGAGSIGTEQIIRSYTTTLTDAQIKTLRATSVIVVPDPGAGQVIDFVRIYLVSNITTAYTNIDAGSYVYFLLDRGGASTTDLQSFVNNTTALASGSTALLGGTLGLLKVSGVISVSPGIDVDQATSGTGQPIQTIPLDDLAGGLAIKMSNSGDLTGGHADNTLSVTALYTVLTL